MFQTGCSLLAARDIYTDIGLQHHQHTPLGLVTWHSITVQNIQEYAMALTLPQYFRQTNCMQIFPVSVEGEILRVYCQLTEAELPRRGDTQCISSSSFHKLLNVHECGHRIPQTNCKNQAGHSKRFGRLFIFNIIYYMYKIATAFHLQNLVFRYPPLCKCVMWIVDIWQ